MALPITIGGSGTLFVGEDKTIRLELVDKAGLPVNMTGWAMVFDVRKTVNRADPPIFSKVPTLTGVFNAVRATNTQRAIVTLTDTEMNTVKAFEYQCTWKRMDDTAETVLAWGPFAPEKATAP
jgi:hypothetical protein